MKATLTFNLPEDQHEFKTMQRAGKYLSALQDLGEHLRQICKHGDPESINAGQIRDTFYEILNGHGIDLFEEN